MSSTQASESWYIVKQVAGHCDIVSGEAHPAMAQSEEATPIEQWGPFASQSEAIARRVGLIRAGKCQPV